MWIHNDSEFVAIFNSKQRKYTQMYSSFTGELIHEFDHRETVFAASYDFFDDKYFFS